jgi:hypothetical protein
MTEQERDMAGGAVMEWSGPVPRPCWTPDRVDVYRAAQIRTIRREFAMAPSPMSPEQVADLVRRVRDNSTLVAGGRWTRHERIRLADLEAMQRRSGIL